MPVTRLIAILLVYVTTVFAAPAAENSLQHNIEVTLSLPDGMVRIDDRVLVEDGNRYRFQLAPWLNLDAVTVNGDKVEGRREGNQFLLELTRPGPHRLEFSLSGNLPLRGNGETSSDMASTAADGIYLPGYTDWIPHDYSKALKFQLQVTVPNTYRAVATGRLVAEVDDGEFYQTSFAQQQPGEAPSLFAGPYQVRELLDDGLRLRTYFHSGLEQQAETYLNSARAYIERYRHEIGDYPYADFHIVSAPLPVGLGFPGLTYVDRRILPLPFMRTRSLAHEVAHSWWGNAVAVDYASGNWAEGLTTYMADYALARDQGEAEARNMRVKWLRDYAALPAARDLAVRDFRSRQHQADQVIGYNKAAFILHMLRREIGSQAFDDGIRLFWHEHRFGTASWQDLQNAFEQSSLRSLDWFFRQWLDRVGAPRLSLGDHRVQKTDSGFTTSIEILQPVTGYQFSLEAALTTEAGVETRSLLIEENLTRLEWTTPERPLSIHFDPKNNLFRRLQPHETPPILRDITLNPASTVDLVSSQPEFADNARLLAARLLDSEPQYLESGRSPEPGQPLMLIVDFEQLHAQLERLQLQAPGDLPDVGHDAAAWTTRLADNTPVLVVTAASAAALRALLRPLPHYGGQSYVLFDAGRAQSRGLWPLSRGALYRDLSIK